MNHNQIVGNEIDHLGYAQAEADYRAHKHGMGCCWLDTIIQVCTMLAFIAGFALVIWLAVGLCGQIAAHV